MEATPALPAIASDLGEIETRLARVVADLTLERRREGLAEVARLEREHAALLAAQADARTKIAQHEAMRDSLRRDIEATRSRVLAAHRRFVQSGNGLIPEHSTGCDPLALEPARPFNLRAHRALLKDGMPATYENPAIVLGSIRRVNKMHRLR